MTIKKSLIIDIQKTTERVYKKKLSADDKNKIANDILNDKEFIEMYERKQLEYIKNHLEEEESPLEYIYTLNEAVEVWNITESSLRNYLNNRGGKNFKDQEKRGLIKKYGGTWIITHKAMLEVFGEPRTKKEET